MFSVHQMHPEAALRLGSSAALGGMAERGRSLQSLITEHGTGLVEPLGGGSHPLFVGRGDCELADQWLYARLPALVGAARDGGVTAPDDPVAAARQRDGVAPAKVDGRPLTTAPRGRRDRARRDRRG